MKNYIVLYIDEKKRLNLAGIYKDLIDAKERLYYVEKNFDHGKGDWQIEEVPEIDIHLDSVMLLNYKD